MFNTKSDYALNKMDADAIIYITADGNITRLTKTSFSSEEEFLFWKAWSDANYHVTENCDHAYAKYTLSLDFLADSVATVVGPDVYLERAQEKAERAQTNVRLMADLKTCLTKTQLRRLWLYYVDEKTEAEIARVEKVGQRRISSSLLAAKRKIKNRIQNL